MSARWRRESSGLQAWPACLMTSKDTSGAPAMADCEAADVDDAIVLRDQDQRRTPRPANLSEVVTLQRVVQPLARSARIREHLVVEVGLGGDRIDILAFDHQPLVDVAHGALVREPGDPRVHDRREHEADLDVERATHQPWCHQRRVQDQAPGRLRTGALRPRAQPGCRGRARRRRSVPRRRPRRRRARRERARERCGRLPAAQIGRNRAGRARRWFGAAAARRTSR